METSFVSSFAEASKNTFRDMFGLEASLASSRELAPTEEHGWDITGLVGLAGKVHGVVAFRITAELAGTLLTGTGVASADAAERRQLEGGLVGELCNIVAGAVASTGSFDFEIAPPVIVRGPNHKIGWPSIAPVVALSFTSASGDFEVDVCAKL